MFYNIYHPFFIGGNNNGSPLFLYKCFKISISHFFNVANIKQSYKGGMEIVVEISSFRSKFTIPWSLIFLKLIGSVCNFVSVGIRDRIGPQYISLAFCKGRYNWVVLRQKPRPRVRADVDRRCLVKVNSLHPFAFNSDVYCQYFISLIMAWHLYLSLKFSFLDYSIFVLNVRCRVYFPL